MRESVLDVEGVRVGVGGGTLFVVTAVLVAAGPPATVFAAVLAAVMGVCSAAVHRSGAVLLGVTGWALCTGFGVNELGYLTFGPADLLRLAAYVGCAVAIGRDSYAAQ